ncbi:MAG: ABC transporter permease subunit [Gaiellaceae bacterium MAG52_C11]|nr:ABC transporter permease subunit [Candidatus Gaiellasilicea maunaloa]
MISVGIWIVYPAIRTFARSFFDRSGTDFVWFDNYRTVFTSSTLLTAIKNNAIWVGVVPALVTSIGLVLAVLTERVRFAVAFRIAIFMPMAISLFAAGVIWRIEYDQAPERGAINAVIAGVHDAIVPPGALPSALPSTTALAGSPRQGFVLRTPTEPGELALLGLTGILPQDVARSAKQATLPQPQPGAIAGVAWRDFRPGGGTSGVVEREELGLPGLTVELRDRAGRKVGTTSTGANGTFRFPKLESGEYEVAIGAASFRQPFGGLSWLGPKLITPAVIAAYTWIWAGFALVIIAAGLAAIPRDLLDAARTDGATEWQVFRRITVPLLAPVLTVVFVTMLINVLKVFDIILAVAPDSVQADANVIALAMWRASFGGVNDFGLGSAIAVVLFLMVVPILALNVRRFRREL